MAAATVDREQPLTQWRGSGIPARRARENGPVRQPDLAAVRVARFAGRDEETAELPKIAEKAYLSDLGGLRVSFRIVLA